MWWELRPEFIAFGHIKHTKQNVPCNFCLPFCSQWHSKWVDRHFKNFMLPARFSKKTSCPLEFHICVGTGSPRKSQIFRYGRRPAQLKKGLLFFTCWMATRPKASTGSGTRKENKYVRPDGRSLGYVWASVERTWLFSVKLKFTAMNWSCVWC